MNLSYIHASLAHFPLALLCLAPLSHIIFLTLYVRGNNAKSFFRFLTKYQIYTGIGFLVVNLFIGDELRSSQNVSGKIMLINRHEDFMYYALYLFIPVFLLEAFSHKFLEKQGNHKVFQCLYLGLLLTGVILLCYGAHQGAKILRT